MDVSVQGGDPHLHPHVVCEVEYVAGVEGEDAADEAEGVGPLAASLRGEIIRGGRVIDVGENNNKRGEKRGGIKGGNNKREETRLQ